MNRRAICFDGPPVYVCDPGLENKFDRVRRNFWSSTSFSLEMLKYRPGQVIEDLRLTIPEGAIQGSQENVRWLIRVSDYQYQEDDLVIRQYGSVKDGTKRG